MRHFIIALTIFLMEPHQRSEIPGVSPKPPQDRLRPRYKRSLNKNRHEAPPINREPNHGPMIRAIIL